MIGKTVSHYTILEKLGEGGMGVVYKAEDTKLGRTVALKFLPSGLTRDADARERFVHEARAAAALDHQDICTIYEIDDADGRSFISMAFIDGERLKDKIARGPLGLEDTVEIAVHIAQGLQAAHEKGIVHRDIKSANVMLAATGQVKVMDFGLAKLAGSTMVTREGTTLGTAGYMSPEQARGEEADNRTDIWSLGVVLYEMITGLLPFRGEYEQALVYKILNDVFQPITGLRAGVPMDIERIVAKCLEKNRDERYQTAADLIADLRHLARTMGAGSDAAQRSIAGAAAPVRKARWWWWAAPLIVAVAIATVAIVMMPRQASPPEEKSIAVLPFVDMSPQHDQEYFCDGMTEELINRLSNIKGLRVPARTSAFFFKGKTGDIPEIGSKLKVQTVLEGSVRKAGDQLRITAQLINVADGYHLWSETYDRELKDVFTVQDEISSSIVSALELKLTSQEKRRISEHPIDDVRAYEFYLKATRQIFRFDEKSLDSAFVYLQTAIDIMGDNAELYAGMAHAYSMWANIGMGQEDDIKRAEEYAGKALALNPNSAGALMVLSNLAIYKEYPENMRDEIRYIKKALAANPSEIWAIRGMAISYAQLGRSSEAMAMAEMLERLDPLNPNRYITRGICYQYDCRFELAAEQYRLYYLSDPSVQAQNLYAWGLATNGRRDEALVVIEKTGIADAQNVAAMFSFLLKCALRNDSASAFRALTPEIRRTCRRDFEWSYHVANRLSFLGAVEEALDWLENAIDRGFINYPYIQCDPFLNNIRGEERFKKLLERAKYEWEHFEVPE